MKFKKIFCFIVTLLVLFPVSINKLDADDTTIVNFSNNYTGLFNEVKDGVVMISNVSEDGFGIGTGMVYKEDEEYLYIMSNHHVVENNDKLYCDFYNGERKEAIVIGYDEYMDIAVLYCTKPNNYKVLTLANSNYNKVGEEVMAIGYPLSMDLDFSVTAGIIANTEVEISYGSFYRDRHLNMIDLALNPGNSGGPTFNVYGQIIGINSVKFTTDGNYDYEGLNFIIPISDAINVAKRIEQNKYHVFVRPYFGDGNFENIKYLSLRERNQYGVPANINNGVYIYSLDEIDNPLIEAGLSKNCIIVSLAGKTTENKVQLRKVLYSLNVYQKVEIKYIDLNDNATLKTSSVAINGLVYN